MRIATRASALALAQAETVASALAAAGGDEGERPRIVPLVTSGDRGRGAADKSRWIAELEDALLRGEADLAVHSAKDVPGELTEGLELLGAPARAGSADVLCGARSLEELPGGGRVGTSSIRRAAQLRAAREDLEVVSMRGNVDTRLRRLAATEGEPLTAIVLAQAGLERLGRTGEIGAVLAPERFVPAPGQGTLALEARAGDERVRDAVARICDEPTFTCLRAERALARQLGASCHTPLGAHAVAVEDRLLLRAWVGLPDGSQWIGDELEGRAETPEGLGEEAARRLTAAGAAELLREAERT